MILSFGGGVSPGTPAENVDALLEAAREYKTQTPNSKSQGREGTLLA